MIQFLKSIALLSLLQIVFSKRSADYFGNSNVNLFRLFQNQQSNNEQPNTYFIRKHGLAFVQSHAVKYLNSKSEKVYNTLATATTRTYTRRNLFSLHLNDIVKKEGDPSKKDDESQEVTATATTTSSNENVEENSTTTTETSSKRTKNGLNINASADIFGLPSWAKGLVSTKELSREKVKVSNGKASTKNIFDSDVTTNTNIDDNNVKNGVDSDSTSEQKNVGSDNKGKKDFALASLINVEALLMASGQIPSNGDKDGGTAFIADMLSQTGIGGTGTDTEQRGRQEENKMDRERESPAKTNESDIGNAMDMAPGPRSDLSLSTEFVLNQATQKLESFLNDATASFSQERVQTLILSATRSLSVNQNADVLKSTIDNMVAAAENIARDQGVDVSEAAAQARATTKYTTEFLRVANGVLLSGYVSGGDGIINMDENENLARQMSISLDRTGDEAMSKPLFHRFDSVQRISSDDFHRVAKQGAVMANMAGAIYQDTVPIIHKLGHSLVANDTSADVAWMVTDSIGYEKDFETMPIKDTTSAPTMIRTITFRGFDATDENMDRDKLLNHICDAGKVPLSDDFPDIQVHRGLLAIAKVVYKDIKPYIDLTGPTHKIVLTGHSIGGAVANLVLMLLTIERGIVFVQDKVKRVYTYGSPPIAKIESNMVEKLLPGSDENMYKCSILETLGLPADIVFGFVEPWVS